MDGIAQDPRAAHVHDHSGSGLGAGHTTVVPDLPFCYVNRGPLLFALPLEAGSLHGARPRLPAQPKPVTPACTLQKSLGCFKESASRQLEYQAYQGDALTLDKCALACAHWCTAHGPHNHSCLAGVEGKKGNQCSCGRGIARQLERLPAKTRCRVACSGDHQEMCGGDWAIDIYNITCAHPLPPNPFGPGRPVRPPPSPPPEWRYALDCDASKMEAVIEAPKSPFDWPLESAITITAEAQAFNTWSSVWELPPNPLPRNAAGGGGGETASAPSVPLTLVPCENPADPHRCLSCLL